MTYQMTRVESEQAMKAIKSKAQQDQTIMIRKQSQQQVAAVDN